MYKEIEKLKLDLDNLMSERKLILGERNRESYLNNDKVAEGRDEDTLDETVISVSIVKIAKVTEGVDEEILNETDTTVSNISSKKATEVYEDISNKAETAGDICNECGKRISLVGRSWKKVCSDCKEINYNKHRNDTKRKKRKERNDIALHGNTRNYRYMDETEMLQCSRSNKKEKKATNMQNYRLSNKIKE